MSFCHNCGIELPEGASNCPDCGAAAGEGSAAYAYDFEHEENDSSAQENNEYGGSYQTQGDYRSQGNQGYAQVPPYVDPRRGYTPPRPAYSYVPEESESNRVLGTGSYFISMLLMSIPVLGVVFQLIWGLGGTKSLNRRNLARSYLIFTVIGLVLAFLISMILTNYVAPLIEAILSDPEQFGDLEGYEDLFGELFDLFD